MTRINGNENGRNQENGAETAFSQDWLGTDGANVPISNPAPRVVGRLPNLFGDAENVARTPKKPRRSGGKTSVVAFGAFGLGVAASFGGSFWLNGSSSLTRPSMETAPIVATETAEIPIERRDFFNDALPEVTSSTLRSVPETAGVGLGSTFSNAPRERDVFLRYGNEFSGETDFYGSRSATGLEAASNGLENGSSLADETVRSNGVENSTGSGRGGGFDRSERRSTKVADVPDSTFATRDNFPTWDDLEADAARDRNVANAPQTAQYPQSSQSWQNSQPAVVANGSAIGSSYAVDSNFSGYPTANFQAVPGAVASDSRNSEYNNANGTGGFADFAQNVAPNGFANNSANVPVAREYVAQVPAEPTDVLVPASNFESDPNWNASPTPNAVPAVAPTPNAAPTRTLRW